MMVMEQATGIGRIGQIAIPVKDVSRATAFYRDVLGLRLQFEVGGMSFFDCDGVRLMLAVPEEAQYDHPASIIYYKVADIAAEHAAMMARGAQFLRDPHMIADMGNHELWMAFLKDTENNTLALMSEKPKS